MELCQQRRGEYLGMEYIESTRAVLNYKLPLNEIIYDFFDVLKSQFKMVTQVLNYEFNRITEKVKLVNLICL